MCHWNFISYMYYSYARVLLKFALIYNLNVYVAPVCGCIISFFPYFCFCFGYYLTNIWLNCMASPTFHPYSINLAGFIHYLLKLMYTNYLEK